MRIGLLIEAGVDDLVKTRKNNSNLSYGRCVEKLKTRRSRLLGTHYRQLVIMSYVIHYL